MVWSLREGKLLSTSSMQVRRESVSTSGGGKERKKRNKSEKCIFSTAL